MEESTIALFCCLDNFVQMFQSWSVNKLIPSERQRHGAFCRSAEEYVNGNASTNGIESF